MRSSVIPSACVEEFFHDAIAGALRNQNIETRDEVGYYLGKLLANFARVDGEDPFGQPLALILAEAVEAAPAERLRILRRMGDVALYVSGFFSDALNRSLVDVGYYIDMGGSAYELVAVGYRDWPSGETFELLYSDLAEQFAALVEVLAEVSEHHSMTTNQGILRLYEKWLRTNSARLARKLSAQGVLPVGPRDDFTRH